MRLLRGVIAAIIWINLLALATQKLESFSLISIDTLIISTAIVVAGAIAGG